MSSAAMPPDGPLSVLIVEDEALLAMEVEGIIEDTGHVVAGWAVSHDDAVALADLGGIDVALVDVHLADGPTGVEVGRALVARGVAHVLFVTANPKRLPADFAGAIGVLSKPYTVQSLRSALAFIQQGVRRPPPLAPLPSNLVLAPDFRERWAA